MANWPHRAARNRIHARCSRPLKTAVEPFTDALAPLHIARASSARERYKNQADRLSVAPPAGPAPREPHGPGIRERGPGGPLFSASVGRPGAVHRSAAPCSPTGSPRSTIGARGLSFRVRNGSGRATPALAADRWAAPAGPGGPRALRAAQRKEPSSDTGAARPRVARPLPPPRRHPARRMSAPSACVGEELGRSAPLG